MLQTVQGYLSYICSPCIPHVLLEYRLAINKYSGYDKKYISHSSFLHVHDNVYLNLEPWLHAFDLWWWLDHFPQWHLYIYFTSFHHWRSGSSWLIIFLIRISGLFTHTANTQKMFTFHLHPLMQVGLCSILWHSQILLFATSNICANTCTKYLMAFSIYLIFAPKKKNN